MNDHPSTDGNALGFLELASTGRNDWWRYLIAFFAIGMLGFALISVGSIVAFRSGFDGAVDAVLNPSGSAAELSPLEQTVGFAVVIWSIVAFLIATMIVVPIAHKRSWQSLIYGPPGFDWTGFWLSTVFAIAVPGVVLAFELAFGDGDWRFQFEIERWIIFLPVALVLLPLQVLAEEVFFRGYVMQAVAVVTRQSWLRLGIPAALFVVLHLANREVLAGGTWAISVYTGLALYLGFLVLQGRGLELAIGFHLGNNIYVALISNSDDSSLSTPSLVQAEQMDWGPAMLAGVVFMFVVHYALVKGTLTRLRRPGRTGM